HRTRHHIVAVAVGVTALGDQQRGRSRRPTALVSVRALEREGVGGDRHVVVDPAGRFVRPTRSDEEDQRKDKACNGFQSLSSIREVTSSSTSAFSGSLNTSW